MELRNDFEDYLQEIFMKEHPMILDDQLPDAFNDYEWDIEELIKYGNEFGAKVAEDIINEFNKTDFYDEIDFSKINWDEVVGISPLVNEVLKAKYLK